MIGFGAVMQQFRFPAVRGSRRDGLKPNGKTADPHVPVCVCGPLGSGWVGKLGVAQDLPRDLH